MAIIVALLPSLCRLSDVGHEVTPGTDSTPPAAVSVTVVELTGTLLSSLSDSLLLLMNVALGDTLWWVEVKLLCVNKQPKCHISLFWPVHGLWVFGRLWNIFLVDVGEAGYWWCLHHPYPLCIVVYICIWTVSGSEFCFPSLTSSTSSWRCRGFLLHLITLGETHSVGLSGQGSDPLQRPLPDNTQHSPETDIHAPQQNLNPQSQQVSGYRPVPYTSCPRTWVDRHN